MACLGCQQSHTGPGQSPAWTLQLHHAAVAKTHQIHGQQQTGRGGVITVGWLWFPSLDDQVSSGMCLQSLGCQSPEPATSVAPSLCPCHHLLSLTWFSLTETPLNSSWSMKRYPKSVLDSFLPCCVWVRTANLKAVELAAAACSSSVGKAGAELTFSKCQKDRPSGRKCRVKEQESEFASKQ